MKHKLMALFLSCMMIFSICHCPVYAEEVQAAKLIRSDATEEIYATVQAALDAASNGENVVLLQASDEVLQVSGKAVGVIYNEFGEPAFDTQTQIKMAQLNAMIIGDLEPCVDGIQNSSNDTSVWHQSIKALATTDEDKSIYWFVNLYKDAILTKDMTLPAYGVGIPIFTRKDVTIDLNGHTITQTPGARGFNTWNNYPALGVLTNVTLKDSVGTGGIQGVLYGINVENGASLTIDGGRYSSTGMYYNQSTDYAGAVIRVVGGSLTIQDAVITGEDILENGLLVSNVVVYDGGEDQAELNIYDATFIGGNTSNYVYYEVGIPMSIYNYQGADYEAEVNLYGGTYPEVLWGVFYGDGFVQIDNGDGTYGMAVTYQVNVHKEQLDGTYTTETTNYYTNNVGDEVSADILTIEHYQLDPTTSTTTGIVTAPVTNDDGSVSLYHLDLYYVLDTLTVSFDAGTHGSIEQTMPTTYKYGEAYPQAPSVICDTYYQFDGWYKDDVLVETFPETVSEDATYVAHYSVKEIPQVQNVNATPTDYKTIQLQWDAMDDATYIIERLNTITNQWITMATTNTNSYIHTGVKTGKTYTYRVKAIVTLDGTAYEGAYSESVQATTTLSNINQLVLTMVSSNRFQLQWEQVNGATRYLVYRKTPSSDWKKLLTLDGDTFTYISNAMIPDTYQYKVVAARYDGSERVSSEDSNIVSAQADIATIILQATNNNNQNELTWNALDGMKYYEVYCATNDTYRRLKVTNTQNFIHKKIKTDTTYQYKVRGYRVYNDQKIYSAYSNVVTLEI